MSSNRETARALLKATEDMTDGDALDYLTVALDMREAETWVKAAAVVDECERNRGTLVGSTLGHNMRLEAAAIRARAAREGAAGGRR